MKNFRISIPLRTFNFRAILTAVLSKTAAPQGFLGICLDKDSLTKNQNGITNYTLVWTLSNAPAAIAAAYEEIAMSRGVQNFKQGDVTKAIKAAAAAGVRECRVEIANGRIVVVIAAPASAPASPDDPNVNEWDTVK